MEEERPDGSIEEPIRKCGTKGSESAERWIVVAGEEDTPSEEVEKDFNGIEEVFATGE
jgi:hypothetical protein